MKQTLLLLCAICSAFTIASAQSVATKTGDQASIEEAMPALLGRFPDYSNVGARYAFVSSLGSNSSQAAAAKTTAVKQRITSLSWVDSTDWAEAYSRKYAVNFYYNNLQRGSDFDYHSMSYLYDYPLDRVPFFNYNIAPASFQGVRSDSTVRMEWCNTSSQLERRLAYGLTYNEGNNRIVGSRKYNLLCGGNLNDVTRTEETYDAPGRISDRSVYYLDPASNSWELFGRQFFRYNAAGKKLVDSVASYLGGVWNPENRIVYSYDGTGNPVSISFEVHSSGSFHQQALLQTSFYAGGEPKTIKLSQLAPGGSVVIPTSLDSFGYTSGAPCFTYALASNYSGSNLLPAGKQIRHLNVQMKPDSITEYTYSSGQFVFSKLVAYTYNSFGNPTMSRLYPTVNGVIIPDTVVIERYTYQDYNETAPTVVRSVASEDELIIYPVPAGNTLNIRCKSGAAIQSGRLRIINTNGLTMLVENMPLSKGVHAVQLGHLPAGVYHLMVDGTADGRSFHQSFIKE